MQQQHSSPSKSPPRRSWTFPQMEPEMAHAIATLGSPSKASYAASQSYGAQQPQHTMEQQQQQQHSFGQAGGGFHTSYAVSPPAGSPQKFLASPPPAAYTYSFSSTPSVFETLLRESEQSAATRSGSKFHEALESLQRLNVEVLAQTTSKSELKCSQELVVCLCRWTERGESSAQQRR